MNLSAQELGVLRHSLGLSASGRGSVYRNHFVTGAGSDDHPACMRLVELRLMVRRPPSALTGGGDLFIVTDAGKQAALNCDPLPNVSLRFGEWLKQANT